MLSHCQIKVKKAIWNLIAECEKHIDEPIPLEGTSPEHVLAHRQEYEKRRERMNKRVDEYIKMLITLGLK